MTGVDAGSKFIKIRYDDKPDGYSVEHFGKIEECFESLRRQGVVREGDIVFTGHYGETLAAHHHARVFDEVAAVVEGARGINDDARHIVNVGSGSIRAVVLDPGGSFHSYRENTLCAAGTGSFLDEQMHRMGFVYETLGEIMFHVDPPDVATRCAVFAKSDLIHHQQEGFSREEMWNGLCRGVVLTMLNAAFRGEIPSTPVIFCGGLFLNNIVRSHLLAQMPHAVFPDDGFFTVAKGAVLLGTRKSREISGAVQVRSRGGNKPVKLDIVRSTTYLDNEGEHFTSDGSEVRVRRRPGNDEPVAIGIDIGSTSTKMALLDADDNVIIDIYRKTSGDPVGATGKCFDGIRALVGAVPIASCGTTGSGRKLVGNCIGADLIVNEITAHFSGARRVDPAIETIFEIGGQDSKYIRGFHGKVADCNMNFVCAAGTGSFIEEQASRLGYDVCDIGDVVSGIAAPPTSDRCTVFMEQDINKLLREGKSREEALAGVILSIAKNYLTRVVGTRPVTGDRVFFQGATARNRGLVAAFEFLTGKEIVVSPYCHVMGAYGAAILARNARVNGSSTFRGFDSLIENPSIRYERCGDCLNKCVITVVADASGRESSWGYKCGKEPGAKPKIHDDHFRTIYKLSENGSTRTDATRGTIGLPRTLSMFNYLPLWRTFLRELGFSVVTSPISSKREKERAVRISKSDFCFPVKIALAHAQILAENEKVDAIFYPTMISDRTQKNKMPRVFCPYVITYPSVVSGSLDMNKPMIAPSVDFRFTDRRMARELHRSFASFGVSLAEVSRAYKKAREAQNAFLSERKAEGDRIIEKAKREGSLAITVIGRPYNLYDREVNLGLTEYFKGLKGVEVFPFEMLIDAGNDTSDLAHVYWNYGERILHAAEKIKSLEHVYPVYFTNFGCGPDSFILTRFEKIMKGKPYLIIELDEHGSDTGYQTRIEAFIDVLRSEGGGDVSHHVVKEKFYSFWDKRDRKLWIPPMHETTARLFAAGFRAYGYDAESLPPETRESFEIGKQTVRGSECLPASTTIGTFIGRMREIGADPSKHAFMMATAEGPCRFGQYMVLHRNILDANGMKDVEIFAPTSTNSYMGMPSALRAYLWDVVVAGDFIFKMVCRLRPYEIEKGSVDAAMYRVISRMEREIEKKRNVIPMMTSALEELSKVPVKKERRPLVGIVGEIYVRSNVFCNDGLIKFIEANGGEAWLSPLTEWFVYTAWMERYFSKLYDKNFVLRALVKFKTGFMFSRVHAIEEAARPFLPDRIEPEMEKVLDLGSKYIPLIFEGETILTIARALLFLEQGASLVVNCSPFGCMPGNITQSIFQKIRGADGKPIVSLFYDGESDMNRIVKVYLSNIGAERG
jgi:predicted CoA-substrate-specific enzyme activase